ncbi:1172_t:CDS:1, partial [Entrophospora sp. SA101]
EKEISSRPEKIAKLARLESAPSEQSNSSCDIKTVTAGHDQKSDQNSETNCVNNNQDKPFDKPVLNSSKNIENPKPVNDKSKSNNEEDTSKPIPSSSNYLTREQREKRLRKWAINHNEDPDVFMTITEKDINLSRTYRDRMMSDADMIQFAKESDDDPDSLMDMTRRERLISEEIYLREWEEEGIQRSYIFDDDEWIEKISILQENGYL